MSFFARNINRLIFQVKARIYVLENLDLDELAATLELEDTAPRSPSP